MATSTVESLFGVTPEALQAQRETALQSQALQYAQLDPMQQAQMQLYMGGNRLGGAIGSLLGAQDPELTRASAIQKLNQTANLTTPEGLIDYARKIQQYSPQAALTATREASTLKKNLADIAKDELSLEQEKKMRAELQALGLNPTPEQLLSVVSKYGSSDKMMAVLTASIDRASARDTQLAINQQNIEARTEAARVAGEARIEAARLAGANRLEIAQMQAGLQRELAQMRIDGQLQLAELRRALKDSPPVDDKAAVRVGLDTQYNNLITEASTLLGEVEKNKEAFTLTGRGLSTVAGLVGKDTPAVKIRSDVDAYLNKARNAYLLEAKGTQTEGDATRAWNEFATSLDFSSPAGTKRSIERIQAELRSKQAANQQYLKARKVEIPSAGGATNGWSIKVK